MECTFLLGKAPAPKRKKAHSEVEILQERLQSIESAYSERLSQMESLLNKVMPGVQLDLVKGLPGPSTAKTSSVHQPTSISHSCRKTALTNDSEWVDSDSTAEVSQPPTPSWNNQTPSAFGAMESSTRSKASRVTDLKEETYEGCLLTPAGRGVALTRSPSTSIEHSFTPDTVPMESDGDDERDLGELAATMDKLRLFDASFYFGKGTMMFSSTDQNKFWDEEITFDVHDPPNFTIPPEAFVVPPLEVIDTLLDIYYSHYYVFLPMIQKTTLLQALEDRYEPQSIFLLNCVFMASALTADCNHPSCYSDPNDPKTLSTPFFERARIVLDFCLGVPRLSTVQGLVMLSRYPKIAGLGHHYIQQAILMALDLGLHRKCDRWIPDEQVQEMRKRLFWCVYVVDSASAGITGRRPLIDGNEVDVPMVVPSTTEGEVEYTNTLFLVHMCTLWSIFRNVKQCIFNAVEVQDMVPGSLPKSYEQKLIQWQLQLPAALRFSFDIEAGDPEAMYNARGGESNEGIDICVKSASKITEIAKVLVNTYTRAFETIEVPEYAMANAVRIHVMFMKSPDPKVAEQSQANVDYMMRFFREFYSSPRANVEDQMINCLLSFFDEFMHTIKGGASDSTAHICASAIKSMVIAKRSKISAGHNQQGSDGKNLSRLVKIGREERAKARVNSMTPPQKKRVHDTQYESLPLFDVQRNQAQQQGSISGIASSPSIGQDDSEINSPPGKFQKVS
ncbi:Transcriptional activator of fatty acid utilization, partial [Modicella reniformis]